MNVILLLLVMLALASTQILAGGRQVLLCLPAYGLLALAGLLSFWPRRRSPIPPRTVECFCAALIFSGYIAIRAFFSPESHLARSDLYAALGAALLYLVIALNVTSARLRLWFVGGILALALANCAVGAVQFFRGNEFMVLSFLPRPIYGARASGFYGYPNHLSGFLEIALLLGLGVTFWSRWSATAKMLTGYICVMCLLGILVTLSRGGYISVVVGLLVFTLLSLVIVGRLGKERILALLIGGLILLGGIGFGVKQVMTRNVTLEQRAGQTLTVDLSRMRLWQAAWQQFRLKPAFGTGSGTYLYYGRQFRNVGLQTDPVHAHNEYFELLAEYGIVGIICAVIFIETHLRRGWTSFGHRLREEATMGGNNSLALTVGALSAAAACLVHCMLDYNLHMPANLLTAAAVFGLLATPADGRDGADPEEEAAGLPSFVRLVLPALGLLLVARVAPTAPAEYFAQRTRMVMEDARRFTSPEPNEAMIAFAQRGLHWDARNPELYYAIGQAKNTLGDLEKDPRKQKTLYAESIEAYQHAVEFAPGNLYNYLALGWTLDSAERFAEAEKAYERAVSLDPRSGAVINSYADHLLTAGNLDAAEAQFHFSEKIGGWVGAQIGLRQVKEAREKLKKKEPDSPAPAEAPRAN